ncbi:hypothetical protein CK203_017606 [Vitis vinifera]|uniref:Uncharacterized protein n=1 Tax=Vitis vinifera TaxID=29760 RepID=A0A438JHD6_VITVI|nr:hypothetical protein CK203_017606 [Vitis vinifera]
MCRSMDIVSDHDVDENHSEKKKKKKKKKSTGDVKKEQNITAVGDENRSIVEMEKKTEAKRSQVRTFGNGLVIEEVAMGKPDGKRASPGKKVILFPLNFLYLEVICCAITMDSIEMDRGRCCFGVESKSIDTLVEMVKGKMVGKVVERSWGLCSWIRFGEKGLVLLLGRAEACRVASLLAVTVHSRSVDESCGATNSSMRKALVGVTTIDDLGRTKVMVKRAESQGRGGGDPRRRVGFGCHGLLGSKDLNPISKRD